VFDLPRYQFGGLKESLMFGASKEVRHNMATARNNLTYLYETVEAINSDQTANRLFLKLQDTNLSSGWALAKSVGLNPDEVERGLQTLLKYRVIGSDGTGLDGYYYVTASGYQLREYLLAK
jgi:hypothetical protein